MGEPAEGLNLPDGNAAIVDSFPAHEAHLTFDTLNVGDSVGADVSAGGNVVVGTYQWQDRSDNLVYPQNYGCGLLGGAGRGASALRSTASSRNGDTGPRRRD